MNDREEALDFLARLGSQPAVAYYESGVAKVVREILDGIGVDYGIDPPGNILARLPGSNPDVPPLAVVAHMDHPGFELVERHDEEGEFVADALGGIPASSFSCRRAVAGHTAGRRTGSCRDGWGRTGRNPNAGPWSAWPMPDLAAEMPFASRRSVRPGRL